MKRRWIILIVIVIAIVAAFGIWRFVSRQNERRSADRMLAAVDLGGHSELHVSGSSSWIDLLKYKDGYEIMLFSPSPEHEQDWTPPASWVRESLPVEELADRLQIRERSETQGCLTYRSRTERSGILRIKSPKTFSSYADLTLKNASAKCKTISASICFAAPSTSFTAMKTSASTSAQRPW